MNQAANSGLDPFEYLSTAGEAASSREFAPGMVVFSQGEPADAVFYIRTGKVKLSLLSHRGKEAIIALLGTGDFFGEGAVAGQAARMATATTLSAATIARVPEAVMHRVLRERAEFAAPLLRKLYAKYCPPLAEIVEPVIRPASSEARNTTQRAISSGSPRRPIGISGRMFFSSTSFGTACTISVLM